MLTEGDEFTVYYNAPGAEESTVAVVPEGGDASEALSSQESGDAAGTMSFDTAELAPGGYDVVMSDEDGDEVARNEFWVRVARRPRSRSAPIARPTASVSPIEVDVGRRAGQPLGLDRPVTSAGADDPNDDDYLLWGYTGGHDSGALPPSVSGGMTPGRVLPGPPVAAAAGRLRRALPADRPVRVGRERRVHRRLRSA